jgi:hypothetical protein
MSMSFEDDLRSALRQEPAPEGFAARVLEKAKARTGKVIPFRRSSAAHKRQALAMAAALALAAVIPAGLYQHRERQRGMEARDKLLEALAITRVQLQQASGRVRHVAQNVAQNINRRRL